MSMQLRNERGSLVTILANADCPHCVQATDTLTEWCCEAGIPVAGVDLARHPDLAEELDIEHSPSVLYRAGDRERIFSGFPTHDQFERLTGGR